MHYSTHANSIFFQIPLPSPNQQHNTCCYPQQSKYYQRGKTSHITGKRTPPLAALKESPVEQKKSCFLTEEDLVYPKQTWKISNTSYSFDLILSRHTAVWEAVVLYIYITSLCFTIYIVLFSGYFPTLFIHPRDQFMNQNKVWSYLCTV